MSEHTPHPVLAADKRTSTLDVLSAAEVSRRLGLGKNQTYLALRRDEIPNIRIGRRFLIPRAAFEEFLKAKA
jgi:excisionase family DNA binding protein